MAEDKPPQEDGQLNTDPAPGKEDPPQPTGEGLEAAPKEEDGGL